MALHSHPQSEQQQVSWQAPHLLQLLQEQLQLQAPQWQRQ
jgi:hypothetical protein